MRPLELLAVYLVLGVVVAATWTRAMRLRRRPVQIVTLMGTVLFWPLFVPLLLSPPPERPTPVPSSQDGELSGALQVVEQTLDAAMLGLRNHEAPGLAPVLTRIPGVVDALTAQTRTVDQMAALIESRQSARNDVTGPLRSAHEAGTTRLRALHDLRRTETLRALTRLEELAGMVQLARFAERPARGAPVLTHQIAATVEALGDLVAHIVEGERAEAAAWIEMEIEA